MGYFDDENEIKHLDTAGEVINALHHDDKVCNNCRVLMRYKPTGKYVCPECGTVVKDYEYEYTGLWSPIWEVIKDNCYVEDGEVYANCCYTCSGRHKHFPYCLEGCPELFK